MGYRQGLPIPRTAFSLPSAPKQRHRGSEEPLERGSLMSPVMCLEGYTLLEECSLAGTVSSQRRPPLIVECPCVIHMREAGRNRKTELAVDWSLCPRPP